MQKRNCSFSVDLPLSELARLEVEAEVGIGVGIDLQRETQSELVWFRLDSAQGGRGCVTVGLKLSG